VETAIPLGESPRGQVVRDAERLVITEIEDFRTTSGYSPTPLDKQHNATFVYFTAVCMLVVF